ncbi:vesicle-associated membrane -associated A isoform X1 [Brachionus plicatilis]|uniref:Vesicle-associated membrane-associated A isoform X1 n=1 Tax=Brachionus plicatilis TaxID=10195 RepID=A0A3M7R2E0_BRAPC|nr:vesicle-associated membrane -associated A isoform X1 [Brachionus plicatilis]
MSEIEKETTGGAVLVDPLGGLVLDPSNELKFRGPFDDYVTVSLVIKNPTEKRIAFKIKTTAPKRYCVKPNSGVLDSQQSMKVNVLLQPFNYDPNEKNKHKFMVQYMYLNESEMQLSVNDILNTWKDVPPTRLLDIKLKCVFEQLDSDQARQDQPKGEKISHSSLTQSAQPAKQESRNQSSRTSNIEESGTSSFESAPSSLNPKSSQTNTNNNSARLDKNDNLANELIQVRHENDLLKKEINKLKEEEARLRKLALQSPAINRQVNNSNEVLIDLLRNRSSIVIIVLLAIIFYLMLFR